MKGIPSRMVLAVIKFYKLFVSPLLGDNCRFYPSCSSYSMASIERFGLARGSILSLLRIMKCAPWHCGGYDPVPDVFPPIFEKFLLKREYSPKGR